MATIYRCPDCFVLHEEAFSAAYVLSARCAECEFDVELAFWQVLEDRPLPEAA
jgi:hypothetical protein